jgi:hypothetical protein
MSFQVIDSRVGQPDRLIYRFHEGQSHQQARR